MSKKLIEVKVDYPSLEYKSLDDAIACLIKIKENNAGKYQNLRLEKRGIPYEDGEEIVVTGRRLENDEEYARRIAAEQENKEWRRKQFEAMKKEFE